MKRKTYLIGAALILLAIIAADFYINEKQDYKANNGDAAQSIPAVNEFTAMADNNIQGSLVADGNTAVAATKTDGNDRRRKSAKHGDTHQLVNTGEYEAAVADNSGEHNTSDLNSDVANNNIAVETPESYLGYRQVTGKKLSTIKADRKKFTLPDNILGLEIGYSQNSLNNDHISGIPTANIYAGLLLNLSFGDNFAIQSGIRYITKGNKLQNPQDVATAEKLTLHYLEVPANLVFKFGRMGDVRFMVGGGPYISYLVSAKDKFSTTAFSDGSDVLPSTPQYSTGSINRLDWGMGAFIGCQSPDGLFAKVGGEIGMMNMMKNTDGSYSGRNANLMVTVGYILGGE